MMMVRNFCLKWDACFKRDSYAWFKHEKCRLVLTKEKCKGDSHMFLILFTLVPTHVIIGNLGAAVSIISFFFAPYQMG